MKIVRMPKQHTLLAFLVVLSTPIFILNLWVMHKGSLVKVLEPGKQRLIAFQFVWMLFTLYLLLKAKWAGFASFMTMSAVLLLANVFLLISTKNYALAFYALFLLILSALYALNAYKDLRGTYYDSGKRWFEGLPRFLPRIEAELKVGERVVSARLSRLGEEGCYAYPFFEGQIDKVDRIHLKLGDLQLECAVELVSKSSDGCGNGLRFLAVSEDQNKDIKDFINRLRSAGYVS
jgi:hypothetical protein